MKTTEENKRESIISYNSDNSTVSNILVSIDVSWKYYILYIVLKFDLQRLFLLIYFELLIK